MNAGERRQPDSTQAFVETRNGLVEAARQASPQAAAGTRAAAVWRRAALVEAVYGPLSGAGKQRPGERPG